MPSISQILRLALRRLAKNRGSNLVAVLVMALGIGLTAATYTLIDVMLFQGLPFEDEERLIRLSSSLLQDGIDEIPVSGRDFAVWIEEQEAFEGLAGFHIGTMNLSDAAEFPERYSGTWISTNFLDLLRQQPALGRGFRSEDADPGADPVALIGHRIWAQRYGADPDIIGRPIRVNAESATIVGVLPEGFRFPEAQDLWMPLRPKTTASLDAQLTVFGRLGAEIELEEAAAHMAVIAQRLERSFPETHAGRGVVVARYGDRYGDEESLIMFGVMFGAVMLVLLAASFNVANLMTGRVSLRSREFAIQSALGSSRLQVISQVLTESLILAFSGACLGLGLAHLAIAFFDRVIGDMGVPYWMRFKLSPMAFLATAGFTAMAALIAGLAPAIRASRSDMRQALSDGSRGSSGSLGRLSRAMVIAQVTVSTALCLGAGLAVRGVVAAQSYDHAFETENLLSARVGLPEGDYATGAEKLVFFDALLQRLEGEPGFESVAIGTVLPAENDIGSFRTAFQRADEVYDRPAQMPSARFAASSPGYFAALGTEILTGRDFNPSDHAEAAPVVIVNESFARREWPGEHPIGKEVDLWLGREKESLDAHAGKRRVVGVVPDLRFGGFGKAQDGSAVYVPLAQSPASFAWIIARTRAAGEPAAMSRPMRRAVLDLDPNLPLYNVHSMDFVLQRSLFGPRFFGTLFGAFGFAALFMASIGLYGLMAFAVNQRQEEMGIRMALGARARDILTMILGQGLRQITVGLLLGLVLGKGLAVVLASQIFQATSSDTAVFLTVPSVLVLTALIACWSPARRAASVDPMRSLRRS